MSETLVPGEILALSGEAADRLLKLDSGDAALLYLCCLRRGSTAGLSWPEERLRPALEKLRSQGLAPQESGTAAPAPAPVPDDAPPQYGLEDISAALSDTRSSFPDLCDEVERRLGRKLSANDLKELFTLYDHLALPAEVILLLVSRCCEDAERRHGPGRKPTVPQIRREGFIWARQGLDTVELAEAHLRRLDRLQSREAQILRLLDIPARPLVERERSYIEAWDDMGFQDDAIRLAYERTVLKKQTMNWGYMNAILRRWHEKGLHTAAAVRAGDRGPAPVRGAAPVRTDRAAENRRAREDMERLRRMMDEMKGED